MIGVMVQLVLSSVMLFSPELTYFPSSYFDANGRTTVQRRAMEKWPGVMVLRQIWWNDPGLKKPGRMAILVGGGVTHDRDLITVYIDAINRPSQPVRKAAMYGYHDLIGDKLPDVRADISDQTALTMTRRMRKMRISLQRNSLVEVWLHAMLHDEGKRLPGFRGYSPRSSARDSLFAVERVMTPEDLESLILAFQVSENQISRVGLMRLIESITLSRFLGTAKGSRFGSGPKDLEQGMKRLDEAIESWRGSDCSIDVDRVLRSRMAEMGATVSDPRSGDACFVWQRVLQVGDPVWWPTAARQLYVCGGPWVELSVLQSDAEWNHARRDKLLEWYGPMRKAPSRSRTPDGPTPPTVQ